MRSIALSILLSLAVVDWTAAADWPSWRGPLGNGVSPEPGLPSTWSTQDGIAWSVPLAGPGVSSPVTAGDRVYVTSQIGRGALKPGQHPLLARTDPEVAKAERAMPDPGGASAPSTGGAAAVFVIEAFDRLTGRRLWEHRLPAEGPLPPVHEKHNLATPSPVTDGERVYAWFGTGQLVALTIDGERVWQRHLAAENGPFTLDWGHGSSPALYGDLLYLLCYHEPASYLLAVDKRSGVTRWKIDRPVGTRSYSTPVVIAGPAGAELLVNSTAGLDAHDPATGELLWQAGGPHSHGIGSPSFEDGVIYTTRGYRSGPYFAVRPGARGGIDASATHVVWRADTGAPYVSSLLVYDGLVYFGSDTGVITGADAATGEKLWQERTGGIFSASPVAGDGKVYFSSETGETFVYASGREPRQLARNSIDGRIVASPAIAGGRIYLRSDDRLIAIEGAR
jgi:outer membrane protein assembly factor BamB